MRKAGRVPDRWLSLLDAAADACTAERAGSARAVASSRARAPQKGSGMKMGDQVLSRRKFLLGSSAAVVGGLLTPGGASGLVSRPRQTARGLSARAGFGPTPITGATVNPTVYHMTNWVQAAKTFDGYVGYPLARTIQKFYMLEGRYPTKVPLRISEMANVGCKFIVCVYPSRKTDQRSQLRHFLMLLKSKGIVYQAALVNEWNCKDKFTPEAYLDYWRHYAPVVKTAGVPLALMVLASSNRTAFAKLKHAFPTDPLPDACWVDYYATGYLYNVRLATSGGPLDQAEKHGVPVGIGEFGWSATGGRPAMKVWDEYCSYLHHLAPRLRLGCVYFGSGGVNEIKSAHDPKVPGLRKVVSGF